MTTGPFTPADIAALIAEDLRLHAPGTAAIIERIIAEHWPKAEQAAPTQENFFDAIRSDPDMNATTKAYWLSMESSGSLAAKAAAKIADTPPYHTPSSKVSAIIATEYAPLVKAADELSTALVAMVEMWTRHCQKRDVQYDSQVIDASKALAAYHAARPEPKRPVEPDTQAEGRQKATMDVDEIAPAGAQEPRA